MAERDFWGEKASLDTFDLSNPTEDLLARSLHRDLCYGMRIEALELLERHGALTGLDGWAAFDVPHLLDPEAPRQPISDAERDVATHSEVLLWSRLRAMKQPGLVVPQLRLLTNEYIITPKGGEWLCRDITLGSQNEVVYVMDGIPCKASDALRQKGADGQPTADPVVNYGVQFNVSLHNELDMSAHFQRDFTPVVSVAADVKGAEHEAHPFGTRGDISDNWHARDMAREILDSLLVTEPVYISRSIE